MTRETGWYVSLVTGKRHRWTFPRAWSPVWSGILSFRQRHSPHCLVQVHFNWAGPEVTVRVLDLPWIKVERTTRFFTEPD
jgi:hypothetical protein